MDFSLIPMFCGAQDSDNIVVERQEEGPVAPVTMNAFELISKSQGLNLSSLFEKQMVRVSNFKNEFYALRLLGLPILEVWHGIRKWKLNFCLTRTLSNYIMIGSDVSHFFVFHLVNFMYFYLLIVSCMVKDSCILL